MLAKETKPRKRDWRALDAAHQRRGELITFFVDDEVALAEPTGGRPGGRPRLYADAFIEALLMVKVSLRLPLRTLEGFARGLAGACGKRWSIPDYTTLCRRQRSLPADLVAKAYCGQRVYVVDSTGLKQYGEGEWKTKTHGAEYRRTWRKVHLLVDRESGQILSAKVTASGYGDATALPSLLPHRLAGSFVLGDGAYHTKHLHTLVHARGGTLLSPPPVNAQRWPQNVKSRGQVAHRFRNTQLTQLQRLGRRNWKMRSGYSQRSFVESTNHRLKCLTGDRLAARSFARQAVEVRLRCRFLNLAAASTCVLAPTPLPLPRGRSVKSLIRMAGSVA